ncbi:hypothetical protein E9R68_005323, partial [Escherichia coli]
MKIRQAQTSATYILPDPGELNKRVLIRQRVDMPADNFGVEPQYPVAFRAWAKVIQTSATCNQVNHLIPTRVLVKGGEIT